MKTALEQLHRHLGSDAQVFRIMRLFYAAMAADVMLGFFFSGRDIETIADRQSEFLLRAMGARAGYSGQPPAQAHDRLPPILPGHFDRRALLLRETLASEGIPAHLAQAWIDFEAAFRTAVVKGERS